jgi:2'-5' RNA ligase
MKRCFVALTIPDETRTALSDLQETLRRLPSGAARKLRIVKPRNLHVTLKFLGDTIDEQIPEIIATLGEVAAGTARPTAILAGVGAFPTPARPRAVFAAFGDGRQAVADLGGAVEVALAELGFEPEKRPRVPHVTIARVEGARRDGPLTRWLETTEPAPLGPIDDAGLVLFESQLDPGGSIYRPLASLPLGAA